MNKKSTKHKQPKVITGIPENVTHVAALTIRKVADKLLEIERDEGYQQALVAVESLNFVELCKLSCTETSGNQATEMPSRFMILYLGNDGALQSAHKLDDYPHELNDQIHEKMSVERLKYYLGLMGYYQGPWNPMTEDMDEDEDPDSMECDLGHYLVRDLFGALVNYTQQAFEPYSKPVLGGTYTTQANECLANIAAKHGIRNWRILLDLNDTASWTSPDVVPEGAVLQLPNSETNSMVDWLKLNQWDDQYLARKGYQYPGKYLSMTIMKNQTEVADYAPTGRRFQIYLTHPRQELLVDVVIQRGDEIDFVVPDSKHLAIWLEGEAIALAGQLYPCFEDYLKMYDVALELVQNSAPDRNSDPHELSWGAPNPPADEGWLSMPSIDLSRLGLPGGSGLPGLAGLSGASLPTGQLAGALSNSLPSVSLPSVPTARLPATNFSMPKIPELPAATWVDAKNLGGLVPGGLSDFKAPVVDDKWLRDLDQNLPDFSTMAPAGLVPDFNAISRPKLPSELPKPPAIPSSLPLPDISLPKSSKGLFG